MRHRLAAAAAALSASVLVTLAPSGASASAATNATCRTQSQAYLISLPSGTPHWSGFDGDTTNPGIGVWTTRDGEKYQLGGNGLKPGTTVTWSAKNHFTGQPLDFGAQWNRTVGSNCVLNQGPSGGISVTAPPGTYDLSATYTGGNTGVTYTQVELIAQVVP